MLDTEIEEKVITTQNTKKILNVIDLRDTEQGILNYMLLSNAKFLEIKSKLSEDDFTFIIHKIIFKQLAILEEMFLSDNYHGVTDLLTLLEIFAGALEKKHNVKSTSTLDILSQTPSSNIDRDLEIINANSMEKEIAIYSNEVQRSGTIETKDGLTWFSFINDRLINVGTTNIAYLPTELHDNLGDTLNSLSNIYLQNGENEATMTFYGDPDNPDGIESFHLKKDIQALKWFDDICQWADKYDLDEDVFPRDRYELQELFKLNISKKGINELPKEIGKLSKLGVLIVDDNNIKEFPDELYKLKHLGLLSFINNEVSYISEEIINLEDLLFFAACHNEIIELPMNFYKLNKLETLCLHGNKLTIIPSEIGNLSSLKSLTISNNDIKILPQSISKLENLESLDIENTQITNISMNLLKLRNLNALSINDELLPFISKNIQYLNVDTINLSASYFQESSNILQELNFKIDTNSWMEDRDKKDNGCVQLSKYEEREE